MNAQCLKDHPVFCVLGADNWHGCLLATERSA